MLRALVVRGRHALAVLVGALLAAALLVAAGLALAPTAAQAGESPGRPIAVEYLGTYTWQQTVTKAGAPYFTSSETLKWDWTDRAASRARPTCAR